MNAVIHHIEYLMSRTDCVIIPGIGALLARYQESRVDSETMVMEPPRRMFSFNGALTTSDGTLVYSLSRAQGISIEAANNRIKEITEAMSRQLKMTGELSLGRIGVLKIEADSDAPVFYDYGEDNLSVATAFLPTIDPLSANYSQSSLAEEAETPRTHSFFARFVRIAASIAILLAVCFVASTPISVNDVAFASLSPEIKSQTQESLMPAQDEDWDDWDVGDGDRCFEIYDNYPSKLTLNRPASDLTLFVDVDEKTEAAQLPYLIIIASFTTVSDADKFVASSGLPACEVIEKNGRFRVSAASFATEIEAYRAVNDFADINGAWVCKR